MGDTLKKPLHTVWQVPLYLIVHVVEIQWLTKGCFHLLLNIFISHRTDKWDNSGEAEKKKSHQGHLYT